jgi:alkanesulfonate monooxygenase
VTLTFHWFLPTSGDGRSIVGRGHSVPIGPDGLPVPNAPAHAAATAPRAPDIDYLAQMAATYQRISRGRLMLNVVTGGQADEQARFGDFLPHDERYARTDWSRRNRVSGVTGDPRGLSRSG